MDRQIDGQIDIQTNRQKNREIVFSVCKRSQEYIHFKRQAIRFDFYLSGISYYLSSCVCCEEGVSGMCFVHLRSPRVHKYLFVLRKQSRVYLKFFLSISVEFDDGIIFTPSQNRTGVIFSLQFVCPYVSVCVCPSVNRLLIESIRQPIFTWSSLK